MHRTSRPDFGGPPITGPQGSAFRIPTAAPESDGTDEWASTTLVLAEVHAGGKTGIGFARIEITERWQSEAMKDSLDLCLACKGRKGKTHCQSEEYRHEYRS